MPFGEQRARDKRRDDQVRISEMLAMGKSQKQIAAELGLTRSTVCRDVKRIERARLMFMVKNLDKLRQAELAKIDLMEKEAWAAWEQSKTEKQKVSVTKGTNMKKSQFTKEQRAGDPRYLEIVQKCMDRRAELLGLNAPQKIAPTTPDGKEPWTAIKMIEVVRPPAE